MLTPDQALSIVLENAVPLGTERVSISEALGRVLADEVRSSRDIPGFDNSAMDGYALRAVDIASAGEATPVTLRVIETIGAGAMPQRAVERGTAARIMTGAPVPPGADAIVQVERTRGTGDSVEILSSAPEGNFIRRRGEDLRLGEAVMAAGRILAPADLGMLASLNRAMVEVYRRPQVAIVATGDELVDVDEVPTGAQIVNSSGYALAGAIREAGGNPVTLPLARDRAEEVRRRLSDAMACDVVLSTGGVSVGQFDYVNRELEALGMRQLFHGVAQRPGRPLTVGVAAGRLVFGLPGNPVSTMVCFYLYARSALLKIGGRSDIGLARLSVRCATDIKVAANLTEFVRVRLQRRDGEIWATPTGEQGSGILSSLMRADGLLVGPARETMLKSGSTATVLLLRPEAGADHAARFED